MVLQYDDWINVGPSDLVAKPIVQCIVCCRTLRNICIHRLVSECVVLTKTDAGVLPANVYHRLLSEAIFLREPQVTSQTCCKHETTFRINGQNSCSDFTTICNSILRLGMGGTRNLKQGATQGQGPWHRGQWKSACGVYGPNVDQGWNCRGLGVGLNPKPQFMSTDAQKSALNFDPWVKFQTFRHLSVLEVSMIVICKLLSSHLDKCIVSL